MTVFFVQRKDGYKVTDIKVHKHTDNFTIIANNVFFDYELSYQAKGLLCQLLSLPPNWKISIDGLSQLATNGNTSVRSILTELCEAGYVIRTQIRNKGKLAGWNYDVYEERQTAEKTVDSPHVENPHTESPHVDDNILLSTNTIKDSNDKVHDTHICAQEEKPDVVEEPKPKKKRKTEPKKTYGEYGWVKLSDRQYDDLRANYSEEDILAGIEYVDYYCETHPKRGKQYSNFKAILGDWGISGGLEKKERKERNGNRNNYKQNNNTTNSTEQGTGASVPDNPFEGMSEEELRKQAEMFGIQWR
jgi:predicted transcriptional regulator